jgi:hypothetical protein
MREKVHASDPVKEVAQAISRGQGTWAVFSVSYGTTTDQPRIDEPLMPAQGWEPTFPESWALQGQILRSFQVNEALSRD